MATIPPVKPEKRPFVLIEKSRDAQKAKWFPQIRELLESMEPAYLEKNWDNLVVMFTRPQVLITRSELVDELHGANTYYFRSNVSRYFRIVFRK